MQNQFNSGFSIPELLISVGIATALFVGGVKLFTDTDKNLKDIALTTEDLAIQKIVENHFITSPRGCETLINKPLNTEFTFKVSPQSPTVYGQGTKIGKIEITGLRLIDFSPFEPDGSAGIVKVSLKTHKSNSKKSLRRDFPVAVNVINNIVESCNFNLSKDFNELVNKICAETYNYPDGTTCEEVVNMLRMAAVEKICQDIYGDPVKKPAQFIVNGNRKFCDINRVHSNESCPGKYLQGFTDTGVAICAD